jgi:hypothetical protein
MPYKNKADRDYRSEYINYDGTEAVKKKRAQRNKARRLMEAAGKVSKGDGKDVDHKKALSNGGTTTKSNLRAVPASANRSFKRNSGHDLVSQTSTKERKAK